MRDNSYARPRSRGGQSENRQGSRSFGQGGRSFGRPSGRPSGGRSFGGGGGRSFRAMPRRKSFDPSMFVKKAVEYVEEVFTPKHTFADFTLHPKLQENIVARGYTAPTPIQDQAIPHLIDGRDLVGLANTGTGKTAAFLIPLINKVYTDRTQKVLIVAPTRELAVQINAEFRQFSAGMKLFSALCIGGVKMHSQIRDIQRRPNFVIGTPGRLRDLEEQRVLDFRTFNNIVLDEVDQMLDMGFIRDVKYITSMLMKERQSIFFSATMPESIQDIFRQFLNNPIKISVKTREAAANVDQDIIRTNGKPKIEVLHELLIQEEFHKVLVFSRTKHATERLAQTLETRGFKVEAIHGNKSQNQRQRAIELFKRSYVKILIATDVASRGLDIDNVSHVINFDLPETYEDYIHRIGRTGRASKKGTALTFVD